MPICGAWPVRDPGRMCPHGAQASLRARLGLGLRRASSGLGAISNVCVAFPSPRLQGHFGALVTNGSGASTPHWLGPERDARGGLVGAQEVGPQTLPPPSVGSGR